MAKILRAIKPNAGVRARYTRRLDDLLEETHRSMLWWIRAAYRREEDRIVFEGATDAAPAKVLEKAMRKLFKRWTDRWDEAAEEIAEEFARNESREVTSSMVQALRAAGWYVKIPSSRAYNDTVQSYIQWNVSLIKSIGEEYRDEVRSLVTMSVANGRDVASLEEELNKRYEGIEGRAHFIARDQTNKATTAMTRAHFKALGIKKAMWIHLPGRKTSRETHIDMHKQIFDPEEGIFDPDPKVERVVKPSELPGCCCIMRGVVSEPGDRDEEEDGGHE